MKVFTVLVLVAICLASIAAHAAGCDGVKPENLETAKAVAANEAFGERIFDGGDTPTDGRGLKGEAQAAYKGLDKTTREAFFATLQGPGTDTSKDRSLIVIGENNEGNGFYSVYTEKGEFLNSVSYSESETNAWDCK